VEKDAAILADAAILEAKAVLAHAAILVDTATLVAATTPADEPIPGGAATLEGKPFPGGAAIPADEATTVGVTTTEDGATLTGIVAVVVSVSGTTVHLTHMAPTITTSRTIATPMATMISGAIGIPQPLAATPTHTGINVSP
jgi:hypothetical protein